VAYDFYQLFACFVFVFCSLTGICQKQHQNLIVAVKKAKDWGLIKFDLPIKHYNYEEYKN